MTLVRIRKFEDRFRIYIVSEDNNEYIIHEMTFNEFKDAELYCNNENYLIVDEKFNPMYDE